MEAQRRYQARQDDFPTGHEMEMGASPIGGFCLLNTITREGVASRTLKVWADRVGEKIRID